MKKLLLLITLLAGVTCSYANKVLISNVSIINNGPGAIVVQFDLSWDRSWRTNIGPANYDGVWVFFKYRTSGGDWTHVKLTGTNNIIPAGFAAYQTTDFNKTGAMIYRDATNMGAGTVTITGIQLGVINTLPYNIDVKAFALEMVYIPPPTFRTFFGDGDGTSESTNAFHYTDNTATTSSVVPMLTDVNGFDDGELYSDGMYIYSNDTIQTTNPLGSLDPFPTMKALWCMKYEINQAAYRDFLNTLTYIQQAARTTSAPSSIKGTKAFAGAANRNSIEIATPGIASTKPAVYGCDYNDDDSVNTSTDGEWIACGYLTYMDVAAYLDWSGLAPMSELQFERICRGVSSAGANAAIFGEYAWGTNTINAASYTLSSAGGSGEVASNASASLGNAIYGTTYSAGPVRSGMFATASSTRITSGSSYYGVMDLSGNLAEYVIHLGSVAGRSTRYVPNGNGTLSTAGNAQLSVGGAGFWPGMEGNASLSTINTCSGTCEVTASAGIMLRGGSFTDPATALRLADRSATYLPTARTAYRGGRGVLYIR